MNYFDPFATFNTPAAAKGGKGRGRGQDHSAGTTGITECQLALGGGGRSAYSQYYPPMPALGSGPVHALPGVEQHWVDPSGGIRQIAPADQRVPFASMPVGRDNSSQLGGGDDDDVDVAAEGLVGLKKTTATATKNKKKRHPSSSARTGRTGAKSSDGCRTPAKPTTPAATSAAKSTVRTPAVDIGPDWTIESVERGDYNKSTRKNRGQYYNYWFSPAGHKFRSKVEVGLFQEALVKLKGRVNEGSEDIAREMVRQAICNKDVSGGLVITDAIIASAISMAKDGDLAKARGHCIIAKRTCQTPGCTRIRKTGGKCRKHHEEEEEEKKSSTKSTATTSSDPSCSRPPPRRRSSTVDYGIVELDVIVELNGNSGDDDDDDDDGNVGINDENVNPRRRSSTIDNGIVELDGTVELHWDDDDVDDDDYDENAANNGIGSDDTSEVDEEGHYYGDDESFDGGKITNGGSLVAHGGKDAQEIVLVDSDFLRCINNIPNLPNTDGIPIDDLTVSPTRSFHEEAVDPPPSPTLTEIMELSDTKPSPPLIGSPLKEASPGSGGAGQIEDDVYAETIYGRVSERECGWLDEEKSNLAWNSLDWGDTPPPSQRTPTARSWKKMVQQIESNSSSTLGRRSSPREERHSSFLNQLDDVFTPSRRRSARLSSQKKY